MQIFKTLKNIFNFKVNKAIPFMWGSYSFFHDLLQNVPLKAAEDKDKNEDLIDNQLDWLFQLMQWIRFTSPLGSLRSFGNIAFNPYKIQFRIKFVMDELDKNPEKKAQVQEMLFQFMMSSSALNAFCETGLSKTRSFFPELLRRSVSRWVPQYRSARSLDFILEQLFYSSQDLHWLLSMDPELFKRVYSIFLPQENEKLSLLNQKWSTDLTESVLLLSHQIADISTLLKTVSMEESKSISTSPFFQLPKLIWESRDSIEDRSIDQDSLQNIFECISSCSGSLNDVAISLEDRGVRVNDIYQILRARQLLARIKILLKLNTNMDQSKQATQILLFLTELIYSHWESNTLKSWLSQNLSLLSKRMVDRAGQSAENYVVRDKNQYWTLFFNSAGGGIILAFTPLAKYFFMASGLPPFFEGFFVFFTYFTSFFLLQLLHFTLATKTPSFTATRLAYHLSNRHTPESIKNFLDETFVILRSGIVSILGNVLFTIPMSILIDTLMYLVRGKHFFSSVQAYQVVHHHDVIYSGTVIFAAYTGLLLWVSSLSGSWIENQFAVLKLSEAFQQNRWLRMRWPWMQRKKWGQWIHQNIAQMSSSLILSLFLAFSSVIASFFGLPLEVRHVTLSTSSLAYSFNSLGWNMATLDLIFASSLSIFLIGFINYFMSFGLAFTLAVRARDLQLKEFAYLVRMILSRGLRHPLELILPPKNGGLDK